MIYDVAARSRRLAVGGVSLLLLGSATAVALAGGSAAPTPPRSALVPNAVAFRDDRNGVLGTGWKGCVDRAWHCRLQGTISVTSDGGKTWRVVRRMPSPVVYAAFFHDAYYVRLLNGVTYWADSAGRSWRRGHRVSFAGYCPKGWTAGTSSDFLDSNLAPPWSICVGEPGAGNQAKAVYRGKKRVAFTPLSSHGGYGGISTYGYPGGIAGDYDGFGLIWESRGTLYVTHDGGYHWHALPKVARPEVDVGAWADADVGPRRTAFVLLSIGDSQKRRLITTSDAGRTWRVVHRWTGTSTG